MEVQGGLFNDEISGKLAFIELNLNAVTIGQPKDMAASDIGVPESESFGRLGATTEQPAQSPQAPHYTRAKVKFFGSIFHCCNDLKVRKAIVTVEAAPNELNSPRGILNLD